MTHYTKTLLAVVATAALTSIFLPQPAWATCSDDPMLGAICWMATDYCPNNYAKANGQSLPVQTNAALASLIGNTYGGDNINFNLPDLQGRSVVAQGQYSNGTVLRGQKRGAATTTMTVNNLPQHQHLIDPSTFVLSGTLKANKTAPTDNSPANRYPAVSSATQMPLYGTGTPHADMQSGIVSGDLSGMTGNTAVSGGGAPIDVTAPRLGLTACIAVKGYYPPRP
ncbi:phage tail protein [Thalassospira sp.]|uniref:phage tail protein n=1 Tax=Thalassospira sp. TaxID=1912094 RepID=UPI00273752E8|nr:tail fiber protein [Thalassospira sp.]MDP2698448.1 tail fiber protein [Thalassospira sp.]